MTGTWLPEGELLYSIRIVDDSMKGVGSWEIRKEMARDNDREIEKE